MPRASLVVSNTMLARIHALTGDGDVRRLLAAALNATNVTMESVDVLLGYDSGQTKEFLLNGAIEVDPAIVTLVNALGLLYTGQAFDKGKLVPHNVIAVVMELLNGRPGV